MTDELKAAAIAAQTIQAFYQWVDRVQAAGGTTSISGIAQCHAMIKSLESNRERLNKLVMDPLIAAIEKAKS